MQFLQRLDSYFEVRKEYGTIFLRLVIGWRLIEGTQDNVFSWARMIEFRNFLDERNVPASLVAAHISVYAQFICGVLFILGAFTRPAAITMIINFMAALIIAHIGTTFQQSFEALVILASAAFFLFYGAGKISVDNFLNSRKKFQ
jgi:putative oxidoreductase